MTLGTFLTDSATDDRRTLTALLSGLVDGDAVNGAACCGRRCESVSIQQCIHYPSCTFQSVLSTSFLSNCHQPVTTNHQKVCMYKTVGHAKCVGVHLAT